MGDKIAAKAAAREAGLPVLEGSDGPVSDVEAALAAADRAGFPILLKAAAGGGGKGMRRVERPGDLAQAFEVAQREAEAAFSDGGLYVERLLEGARHVEIQVMADGQGGVLVCGDRECSIQRRHQKLIEEASAPHLPAATREAMQQAALRACKAWDYRSAGTLEFLVDAKGDFFFLELNARLQVEHPVTELVTGLDLVAEQLHVAAGGLLSQTGVAEARGHAIECRINAEDPSRDFRPGAGRLDDYRIAQGPGIRVDTHCEPGENVPPHYDSLLGKLIVWAADRPRAVARLRRALARDLDHRHPHHPAAAARHRPRRPVHRGALHHGLPHRARAVPAVAAGGTGGLMARDREGGRRAARRQAVILLYQHDVTGLPLEELEANAEREGHPGRPVRAGAHGGRGVRPGEPRRAHHRARPRAGPPSAWRRSSATSCAWRSTSCSTGRTSRPPSRSTRRSTSPSATARPRPRAW